METICDSDVLLLDVCEVLARGKMSFADMGELLPGGRELFLRRVGSLEPKEDTVVAVSEIFTCATELDMNRV